MRLPVRRQAEPARRRPGTTRGVEPSGRPVGELAVVAVCAGALAAGLGALGLAAAWTVLLGVAVGIAAPTPAAPRGAALLAGGLAGWGAAAVRVGLGAEIASVTGLVVAGLVLVAVLTARATPGDVAAWPAVLGAGALLITADPAAAPNAAEALAVLVGLAVGVVAVVVAEVVTAWRSRPLPVEDER